MPAARHLPAGQALDPARNHRFRDRCVGLPLDLTGVLFVAVATDPARIPPLLQERLEALPLAGYTDVEEAAHRDRAPGQRLLARAGRARPRRRHRQALPQGSAPAGRRSSAARGRMGPEGVSVWLGAPRFRDEEIAARTRRPGVALGLAATGEGGDVLLVEAACLPGRGTLRVTGTVGPMTSVTVLRFRRRGPSWPCSRSWPCGPTYR